MHDRPLTSVVLAALVTACGSAGTTPAAYSITSVGAEHRVTESGEPPASDVAVDHDAARQRPVRLPDELSDERLVRDETQQADAETDETPQAEADETSICPADVPTLHVRTSDVLDGAALVLTADTTEDRAMLRERMQRFAQLEERARSIQRAIDLAAWDVPPVPATVPSPREVVDDDDPLRPTHGVHVVMIPRGVRLELRQDDGAQSTSAHELRRRVEEDAQALRARRCPLTFQPA